MEKVKNCLKMTYCGLTRYLICEVNCSYEDIIEKILNQFDIPKEYGSSILITNGNGYIFNKDSLLYFLVLFPSPEITFFIRLDSCDFQINTKRFRLTADDSQLEFYPANTMECPKTTSTIEDNVYKAVPVYRQHCFLGKFPANTAQIPNNLHVNLKSTLKTIKRRHILLCKKIVKSAPKRSLRI
ncbi:uncharacterized protein LOC119676039 [Teleopsis dalmanni]|uniref:uncharacterized protein LOC119676039 n=1 Tax=Teleopsis dalmanni TaxID=139649 RepID=UPI0018CDEFE5|nr:uncharacterized protein LOC119676039 [Teleopsis dalmanni]